MMNTMLYAILFLFGHEVLWTKSLGQRNKPLTVTIHT